MIDLQQNSALIFVIIGLFVGILMLGEAVRQSVAPSDGDARQKSKRMRMLAKGIDTEGVLLALRPPVRNSIWTRVPYFGDIPARMRQAGMQISPRLLVMACLLVAALIYVFAVRIVGALPAFLLAFMTGVVLPMSIINIARNKRVNAFAQQLPEALDLMKRGLTVGHPLSVTIATVGNTMPDPIGTEFGLMADQIAYGEELTDAMMALAHRIDQEDMFYLAASVQIQHGSGGNLAAMLGTLSRVIRRRYAMRRKIKAVSSEGRISAYILTALPFLMFGGTTIMAPTYYTSVAHDPLFIPMAVAMVTLVVGNGLMLRKLVTFRI